MKRAAIAAAWILGATIPLLGAVVLVFGCCVLPFHRVIHRMMPFCEVAADFIRGGHASGGHDPGPQPPLPARAKQEPVKRTADDLPRFHPLTMKTAGRHARPIDAAVYRTFISFGAIRCDRDVGLYLLAGTLLI